VSLALGVSFVVLAILLTGPEQIDAVSAWLGYINLSLFVFNLLPALPLDGGRILRAALWRWRDDFSWATRISARIGRMFGYAMIAGGVVLFIVDGAFSGAWLAFLGWFLLQAAAAEEWYLTQPGGPWGDLLVGDAVAQDPISVEPGLSIGRFMDEVARPHPHGAYPVVVDGRVEGLLSLPLVAELPRAEWDRRRVGDRMLLTTRVPVFAADTAAVEALAELVRDGGGQGLVLAGDRLVGVVTLSDLARALDSSPERVRTGPAQRA
jgi:CBS domain-containing protein